MKFFITGAAGFIGFHLAERLLKDKKKTVIKVLEFLNHLKINIIFDDKKLNKTIETTEFENMKKLEKTETFYEAVVDKTTGKRKAFFNLGPKNDWRVILDKVNREKIEKSFKEEMQELGYLKL